jgi:hypothetical protein
MSAVTYEFNMTIAVADVLDWSPGGLPVPTTRREVFEDVSRRLSKHFGLPMTMRDRHPSRLAAMVTVEFATETDAVLFRMVHGDCFLNPRLVTDDAKGGPH